MKSNYTSNNIINLYRESVPVLSTTGIHEILDNSSCFNHVFCTSNKDEFVRFADRSNISTYNMLNFHHSSSTIILKKDYSVFSNHTFSNNLKNL
ncbi:hypothetical protein [Maribacter sp. R86514]|uniref:hypothetical protein n=1 Tax=Maribacter sp. R86514 TaxID=3093854 RepID=UPI0037C6E89D